MPLPRPPPALPLGVWCTYWLYIICVLLLAFLPLQGTLETLLEGIEGANLLLAAAVAAVAVHGGTVRLDGSVHSCLPAATFCCAAVPLTNADVPTHCCMFELQFVHVYHIIYCTYGVVWYIAHMLVVHHT